MNPPKFGTQVTRCKLCFAHRSLESIAIMIRPMRLDGVQPASHASWN